MATKFKKQPGMVGQIVFKTYSIIAFTVILFFITLQSFSQGDVKTGYAPVNGLKMYYEIHGTGQPLVLIHGGFGSTDMFGPNMAALAKGHQVIAVDLQGHGRTADIDRPLSFELMADDIAELLKYLKISKADIVGYSVGGAVGIQTVLRHPDVVRKLVIVSAAFKRSGFYPGIIAQQDQMGPGAAEALKPTPIYQSYAKIAPKPENWVLLVTKISKLIQKDYDWSDQIKTIKVPTMLVFGDADLISPTHAVEFFNLLGGGLHDGGWDGAGISNARLAILPGVTHYNIFMNPALAATIIPYLDQPVVEKK